MSGLEVIGYLLLPFELLAIKSYLEVKPAFVNTQLLFEERKWLLTGKTSRLESNTFISSFCKLRHPRQDFYRSVAYHFPDSLPSILSRLDNSIMHDIVHNRTIIMQRSQQNPLLPMNSLPLPSHRLLTLRISLTLLLLPSSRRHRP